MIDFPLHLGQMIIFENGFDKKQAFSFADNRFAIRLARPAGRGRNSDLPTRPRERRIWQAHRLSVPDLASSSLVEKDERYQDRSIAVGLFRLP